MRATKLPCAKKRLRIMLREWTLAAALRRRFMRRGRRPRLARSRFRRQRVVRRSWRSAVLDGTPWALAHAPTEATAPEACAEAGIAATEPAASMATRSRGA